MAWGFDHLVVQCADVEASVTFYCGFLGLAEDRVEEWRAGEVPFCSARVDSTTLIDLLPAGSFAGSADGDIQGQRVNHMCLTLDGAAFDVLLVKIEAEGVEIVDGPGIRYGARGMPCRSTFATRMALPWRSEATNTLIGKTLIRVCVPA